MMMKVHVNGSTNIVSLFYEFVKRELNRGMWSWAQVMLDVPWRCWPTNQPTNQAALLPLHHCDKNQAGTLHFVGDISAGYLESCTDTSFLPPWRASWCALEILIFTFYPCVPSLWDCPSSTSNWRYLLKSHIDVSAFQDHRWLFQTFRNNWSNSLEQSL